MSRDMAAREPFYAQAQLIVDCGELSDDELDNVAGGGCNAKDNGILNTKIEF